MTSPNDPLREETDVQCFPPGQVAVAPLEVWGPSVPPVVEISRGWYFKPALLPGYSAKLMRLSARCKSTVTGLYNQGVSPRLVVAFLDPDDDATPNFNAVFNVVPAGLIDPLSAEVLFFAAQGTWDVVNVTNDGKGYEFGKRDPMRYRGIWVGATVIKSLTLVQITPVIQYVEEGVGQGG